MGWIIPRIGAALGAGLGFAGLLLAPMPAQAQPRPNPEREAVVANETGLAVRELYMAPASEADPGPDRLGADTLPPGGSFRVRLGRNQPCSWSLRAILADETMEERRNVDLCRSTRVLLGDSSVPAREASIVNDTDLDLRELYAAPPGAARGPDRLGAEVVPSGRTHRLRLGRRRDCLFDITAVMMDGSEVSRPRVDVCRTPRVTLADPSHSWRDVTIANRAGRPLHGMHVVAAGRGGPLDSDEGWSVDRMGEEPAPDGSTFRLRLRLPGCEADLRAVYEDGAAEAKRGVNICTTSPVIFDGSGIPRPPERPLTIVNRHGARIDEIYVSSSSEGDWGPERLPGGLDRNESRILSVPVDCVADIRVVFPTGGAEERREVNICQVAAIAVRPGWTIAQRLDEGEEEDDGPRPGSVRLRNTARLPIIELYIDPPNAPQGVDRLGATVLGANETLDVAPPDGGTCPARLTAVFRDGREVTRDPIDLCAGIEVPLP
ncbi:hypothetical protein J8J14_17375 [Roseomonas sp. SSH11]|uniref:Uncharacterized protein n=1 Tax=Pararoseomonas baculiformis TaxID=2820812 RepID=A0ABS4AHN7_9PROT|nr:hypothetical protein [Pararoseomonas baculiformis]MBP0446548.1 hypothetical protein [Pararoseomonas baculiformis]